MRICLLEDLDREALTRISGDLNDLEASALDARPALFVQIDERGNRSRHRCHAVSFLRIEPDVTSCSCRPPCRTRQLRADCVRLRPTVCSLAGARSHCTGRAGLRSTSEAPFVVQPADGRALALFCRRRLRWLAI